MNWLGYSEEEVWQLTPLKWQTLMSTHIDLFNKKWGGTSNNRTQASQVQTGYIDQIGW